MMNSNHQIEGAVKNWGVSPIAGSDCQVPRLIFLYFDGIVPGQTTPKPLPASG
jgi:hypothetical protein